MGGWFSKNRNDRLLRNLVNGTNSAFVNPRAIGKGGMGEAFWAGGSMPLLIGGSVSEVMAVAASTSYQ